MSTRHQPTDGDPERKSESEKDELLERLAERVADDDPELSAALELASQASPEESN
ncbi:hypothetical protein [Halolamina rubra]|uniref:hypothetical protein n=1 Tax=Halolamina rubra TaxID=1380430 RepID=UPI0012AB603D|nr:hypothetical protein [Halolamina rubra]